MGGTQRPTAGMDRASLNNDIAGVDQAIREYARADEVVVRIRVVNSFTHQATLCLEPYAEEVVLAPGQGAVVFACGPEPQASAITVAAAALEIEFGGEPPRITVWLWAGALGYVVPELNEQVLPGA